MEEQVVQNKKQLEFKKHKIVGLYPKRNEGYCAEGQTQQTTEGSTGGADAVIMVYLTM